MSTDLYEPKGKDGVGDLTSTLLPWGTAQYDRAAYQAQADAIPANITLGPSFSLEVQSGKFAQSLQLLADGMLHPAFSPASFQIVKSNSVRTLDAVEREPRTQAQIARLNALYPPGDPRRRRETSKTISAIALDDVKKWYAFAYRPDLTVISVVGDVDPKAGEAAVRQVFGQWHATGPKPSFRYPQTQAACIEVRDGHLAEQHAVASDLDPDHQRAPARRGLHSARLADTMLSGEGPGSMLFRDLREKRGYVYDVSSDMEIGRSELDVLNRFCLRSEERYARAICGDRRDQTPSDLARFGRRVAARQSALVRAARSSARQLRRHRERHARIGACRRERRRRRGFLERPAAHHARADSQCHAPLDSRGRVYARAGAAGLGHTRFLERDCTAPRTARKMSAAALSTAASSLWIRTAVRSLS